MFEWVKTLLNRATVAPPQPGAGNTIIYLPRTTSGVRVTEDNALKYAAVWACVRAISEDLASMSWHVLRRKPDGVSKEHVSTHPVDWLLHHQPNPEMGALDWRQTMLAHALTWGNGYSEIERDGAGRPVWLWPIAPDRVTPKRDGGGMFYEVSNGNQEPTFLRPEEMFHLKGLGFDGLVGYSVITMAAQSIGMGMATEEFGAAFYGNNTVIGGYLSHPGKLSTGAKDYVEEMLIKKHGGPRNAFRPMVLQEGMEWKGQGVPPDNAQFIETKDWQITDIARWYRVPLHKLAHLLHATFSNIEHQEIGYVIDTLTSWATRLEQEANGKLFGRQQRGVYFTKINLNSRLRGDSASRSAFYRTMFDMGVFSVNDILELEDRNPIGPDGDKRLVQLNLTTLEKAGEQPAQPPVKPAQEGGDKAQPAEPAKQEDTDAAQKRVKAAHRILFEDAAARVLRREGHRLESSAKKYAGDKDEFEQWVEQYRNEVVNVIRDAFRPAVLVVAEAMNIPPAAAEDILSRLSDCEADIARVRLLDWFGECSPMPDANQVTPMANRIMQDWLGIPKEQPDA